MIYRLNIYLKNDFRGKREFLTANCNCSFRYIPPDLSVPKIIVLVVVVVVVVGFGSQV